MSEIYELDWPGLRLVMVRHENTDVGTTGSMEPFPYATWEDVDQGHYWIQVEEDGAHTIINSDGQQSDSYDTLAEAVTEMARFILHDRFIDELEGFPSSDPDLRT